MRGSEIRAKNRVKRFKFAKKNAKWTIKDWSMIVFSDEATLYPKKTQPHIVWSYSRSARSPPFEGDLEKKKINVWGYIRSDGEIRLFCFKEIMTTERYLMLLRENLSNAVASLRGSGETLTFMQDNATYHTAYKVINWLGQNHIKQIVWPPQSPDLSPIENVWASIQNEL